MARIWSERMFQQNMVVITVAGAFGLFLLLGTLYSTESGSFASSSAYSSLTSKNTPFLTSTARFAIEDAQSRFNDATTGLSEFETVPWDKKITMVLPLLFADVPRALLLFKTLKMHFPAEHVAEMIIICPEAEAALLTDAFALPWPVRVIEETSLLPVAGIERLGGIQGLKAVLANKEKFGRGPSYYLQMSLKLFVSRLVRTQFYLVLDADVAMLYDLPSIDILLPSPGRAAYLVEQRQSHEKWWANAEAMLQLNRCNESYLFGVTPALLSKELVARVIDHLETKYGYDVLPTLLFPNTTYRGYSLPYPSERETPCWTEYTAYRTYTCQEPGLFDRYHAQPPSPYLLYSGYWYASDYENSPEACIWGSNNEYRPVFCVVQSHTGIEIKDAYNFLKGKVPLGGPGPGSGAKSPPNSRAKAQGQGQGATTAPGGRKGGAAEGKQLG